MRIIIRSKEHLKENKMTYCEHFIFAFVHGVGCVRAGFCLMIHSIIPGFLPATGSKLVTKLNKSFTDHSKNNS